MTDEDRRGLGRVFDEVPELYDRVRPGYPDELFVDLVAITGVDERSSLLEVGCGTGQATRSLAALGCSVTAVDRGPGMAQLTRQRLATLPNVEVETSSFEEWDDRGRRFDVLVSAAAWHWLDPTVSWRRAHEFLRPGGWLALLGHVVVRRPDEPEVYAETADLHEQFAPGNPAWRHPPHEEDVSTTDQGWGPPNDSPAGFVRPDDRAVVPDGAVAGRGRVRRSPPLHLAVPGTRPRCPRAAARGHHQAHPHSNG